MAGGAAVAAWDSWGQVLSWPAGWARAAAGGPASNSRNRLVSRILYFETQTRVRETECSDTETVMIVF